MCRDPSWPSSSKCSAYRRGDLLRGLTMKQLSLTILHAITLCAVALGGSVFAADRQPVTALAGRVYEAAPTEGVESATHIHLTPQDLYKPTTRVLESANGASTSATNAWGAAGAGAAPIAASGPARVYTTMAAAAAAGIKPFSKPAAGNATQSAHASRFSKMPHGRTLYALIAGLCALALSAFLYIRRRRNSSD